MTELILHVGVNKTGSSSIQKFIQVNAAKLQDLNFVIPDKNMGLGKQITGEHVFELQKYLKGDAEQIKALQGKFEKIYKSCKKDGQKVLISAENLGTAQAAKVFKSVLDGRPAKVIIYIRRQDELIESSWQQWHSKVNQNYDAWLLEAIRIIGNWENILNCWEACVGQENIHLEVFERPRFPQGNIIRDFIDKIGVSGDDDFELDLPDANPTYAQYITPLVEGNERIFDNVHDNEFYKMIGNLTGSKFRAKKKYSLMSRKQRENILKYFAAQNRRVCAKYFPERKSLFSELDHEKYTYLTKESARDLQLKFITTMLFELGKKVK